jgi:hypothetical protein
VGVPGAQLAPGSGGSVVRMRLAARCRCSVIVALSVASGGRGIGAMIAAAFVENGVKVYITSRDSKACSETAARLSATGTQVLRTGLDTSPLAGVGSWPRRRACRLACDPAPSVSVCR